MVGVPYGIKIYLTRVSGRNFILNPPIWVSIILTTLKCKTVSKKTEYYP